MCTSLKFTSKITAPCTPTCRSIRSCRNVTVTEPSRKIFGTIRGTAYYHVKLANIAITIHVDVLIHSKSYNIAIRIYLASYVA